MKNTVLSIIVPVYNKENTLNQCLESLCVDEIADKLEVIVIDDGSSDRSKEIIERYVRTKPDIFKGIYKENGGVGSVMNLGIMHARGRYIKEVDADDWVDSPALEKLVQFLLNTEPDLVLNPYQEVNECGKREDEHYFQGFRFGKIYPIEQIIKKTVISIQTITIKTSILKDSSVSLSEQRFYIDMQIVEESIFYSRTCVVLSDSLYRYRVGQEDQSVNINNYIKHRECFCQETLLSLDRLEKAVNLSVSAEKIDYQKNMCYMYVVYLYGISFLDEATSLAELDRTIKDKNKEIYEKIDEVGFIEDFHKNDFSPECEHREKFYKRFSDLVKENDGISQISLFLKVNYNDNNEQKRQELKADKYYSYYSLMNQWMINLEQGMEVSNYFKKNNYNKIAIYGMRDLGVHLLEQLANSPIKVAYGIDRADNIMLLDDYRDFIIKKPFDELEMVDVIVVTALNDFGEIKKNLLKKMGCTVVSLAEVICES